MQARITEQPNIQGLHALILDAPRPGILLSYQGEQPLTVLGIEGEAFLRFTGKTVMVNPGSPSWRALPNAPDLSGITADAGETWETLSQSASFGWLDPRLEIPAGLKHQEEVSQEWSITLQTASGERAKIVGELRRKSLR